MTESLPFHERALEELQWLRALAARLVRDPDLAEDAVQDTLLRTLERRPSDPGALRAWLRAVLRNTLRQQWRGGARRTRREQAVAEERSAPSTLELVAELSLHRRLVEHVDALEAPYRDAIVLRYLRGRTPAEAAADLGLPRKTFHTRLERALVQLRERLGRDREAWLLFLSPAVPHLAGPVSSAHRALPKVGPLAPSLSPLLFTMNLKAIVAVLGALVIGMALYLRRDAVEPAATTVLEAAELEPAPRAMPAAELAQRERAESESSAERTPSAGARPVAAPEVAQLRGSVRALDGRGIPGLRVVFEPGSGAPPAPDAPATESGPDGVFTLPLPEHPGRLSVVDASWACIAMPHLDGTPPLVEPLIVVAPARSYAGRVVDPTGNGLARARVELTLAGSFLQSIDVGGTPVHLLLPFAETLTDETCAFLLSDVGATSGAILWAEADGFLARDIEAPPLSAAGLELVLSPRDGPRTIHGLVLDAGGGPVEGARVSLGGDSVASAPDGRFTLDCETWRKDGWLRALKPGALPAQLALQDLALPSTPEAPIVLRLGGPPLAIEGRVLDARGEPLAGALVFTPDVTPFGSIVFQMDGNSVSGGTTVEALLGGRQGHWESALQATTDARGRFVLPDLLERSYALFALDPRSLAGTGPIEAWSGGAAVTLQLDSAVPQPVAGRVLSRSGTPMAGVKVSPGRTFSWRADEELHGDGWTGFPMRSQSASHAFAQQAVLTDAEGRFAFPSLVTEGAYLTASSKSLVSPGSLELVAPVDPNALEIVVDASSRFRLVLEHPGEADRFTIETADGGHLGLYIEVDGAVISAPSAELLVGRSGIATTSEGEHVVVLHRGPPENATEVRRRTLFFPAGGLHELEL